MDLHTLSGTVIVYLNALIVELLGWTYIHLCGTNMLNTLSGTVMVHLNTLSGTVKVDLNTLSGNLMVDQ